MTNRLPSDIPSPEPFHTDETHIDPELTPAQREQVMRRRGRQFVSSALLAEPTRDPHYFDWLQLKHVGPLLELFDQSIRNFTDGPPLDLAAIERLHLFLQTPERDAQIAAADVPDSSYMTELGVRQERAEVKARLHRIVMTDGFGWMSQGIETIEALTIEKHSDESIALAVSERRPETEHEQAIANLRLLFRQMTHDNTALTAALEAHFIATNQTPTAKQFDLLRIPLQQIRVNLERFEQVRFRQTYPRPSQDSLNFYRSLLGSTRDQLPPIPRAAYVAPQPRTGERVEKQRDIELWHILRWQFLTPPANYYKYE